MKKIIRQFYYIFALVFFGVVYIIPYRIAVKLGGFLGRLAYYIVKKSRNITLSNLKLSFPEKSEKEIKKIAVEVFVNQGKNMFELFSYPKVSNKKLSQIAKIENPEGMKKALEKGKGVLIASAHCGNWEMMGATLAINGFPINVIAKRVYIEGLNKLLVSLRNSKGVQIIYRAGADSAKKMLRCLKRNESIGLIIDQDTMVQGVFVNYFGRPAWTPSGLASLAIKTEAAVVTALGVRLDNDNHKVVLSDPIEVEKTDNLDNDILNFTQKITSMIENHVRQYPSQWVWMHERWKTKYNENSTQN